MTTAEERWGLGVCAMCGRKVAAGMLMCRSHWQRVPRPLQREVYVTLDAWYAGAVDLEVLRDVQCRAVRHVEGLTV